MGKIKLSQIKDNPQLVKEIKVKQYLPLVDKMILIEGFENETERYSGIVDDAIKQNNEGMYCIDYISKKIATVLGIIQKYAEIEFDDVEVDNLLYDFCITSGIWNKVKSNIPESEYFEIIGLIDDVIEQEIEIKNSVASVLNRRLNNLASVLNRGLNRFIDKIPTDKQIKSLSKSLVKDMKNFDWDSVPKLKEIYQTIIKTGDDIGKNSK